MVELTVMLQTTTTGVTLDDIVERFEVSRRTAERMLAALRANFIDIEATARDGRKFWRLPRSERTGALKLPAEIADLAKRVELLTAEVDDARAAGAMNHAIVDHVLAKSTVGICLLDTDFRVVWTNEALRMYFGPMAEDIHGHDKRELIRTRFRSIISAGDEFERRVLGTYADNTYVESFDFCITEGPGRDRRWLRHWSRPIQSGIYTGGRVEYYVDLSALPLGSLDPRSADLDARWSPVVDALSTKDPGELIQSVRNLLASLMTVAEHAQARELDPYDAIEQILRSGSRIAAIVEESPPRPTRQKKNGEGEPS